MPVALVLPDPGTLSLSLPDFNCFEQFECSSEATGPWSTAEDEPQLSRSTANRGPRLSRARRPWTALIAVNCGPLTPPSAVDRRLRSSLAPLTRAMKRAPPEAGPRSGGKRPTADLPLRMAQLEYTISNYLQPSILAGLGG